MRDQFLAELEKIYNTYKLAIVAGKLEVVEDGETVTAIYNHDTGNVDVVSDKK